MANTAICVKCEIAMKPERVGVILVELYQSDKDIYKIWHADLKKCPGCGAQIVMGLGAEPVKTCQDQDRHEYLELKKKSGLPIIYWREKTCK